MYVPVRVNPLAFVIGSHSLVVVWIGNNCCIGRVAWFMVSEKDKVDRLVFVNFGHLNSIYLF